MQYIKFGFGRCIRDSARLIQQGHLSITKAKEYIKKYDGELPEKNLDLYLDYLDINYSEFFEIIDSHRNNEIWVKRENKWELRNKINYE